MQNLSPSIFLLVESVQDFFQCLIRDLTLSTNTVSATVGRKEEDFTTWFKVIGLAIRTFASNSCALDKYDIPIKRTM